MMLIDAIVAIWRRLLFMLMLFMRQPRVAIDCYVY